MIFDTLNNFANYARLAPGTWAKLAAFLHGCTAETPAGRYEIDGDRLYAMVQSYNLHPVRPEKLEIHRNYVDTAVSRGSIFVLTGDPAYTHTKRSRRESLDCRLPSEQDVP